jgi:hypothetical protein
MNAEELNRLIGKYYNGESTEEEESTLREYFNGNNILQGYEAEKEIFGYYTGSVEIPDPSSDFEARILAGIDASERIRVSLKVRRYLIPVLSTAAGLLLLGGSYFLFTNRPESTDTFKDPQIAYAETLKILREVSSQMNRGTQVLEPVAKINEMTKNVGKNLKNLDWLQKAIEITSVPVEKKINK